VKNSYISSFENDGKYKVKRSHLLTFVVLIFSSLACSEGLNRYFIRHLSRNFLIHKSFVIQRENIELLFLGDSHFMCAINPQSLGPKAFSLSFPAASYIQSYYMLNYHMDRMPRLRLVVLPLDLHSFSSFRSDHIDTPTFWNNFIDYRSLIKVKGLRVLRNKLTLTIANEGAGRTAFITNLFDFIWHGRCDIGTIQQRLPVKTYPALNEEKALRKARSHFDSHTVFDEDILLYFKKILKLCRNADIAVVTVQTPVSKPYFTEARKHVSPQMIRQKIAQDPTCRNLISGNLDYLQNYLDRDDLFIADGDHLNEKGRGIFSQPFCSDITKIIHMLDTQSSDGRP